MSDEILRRLERLETAGRGLVCSDANVSNPPTDAELDAEFGAASTLYDGWAGLVDDAGAGTAVWFVVVKNGRWWYELLTAAV